MTRIPEDKRSAEHADDSFGTAALDMVLELNPKTAVCALALDGRIETWHGSARQLLGHPAAEVEGQPLESLCPQERRFEAALPRALFAASARGHATLDSALQTRSGERQVCVLDIHVRNNSQGDIAGFLVLIRDGQPWSQPDHALVAGDALAYLHRVNLSRGRGEPAWIGLDLAARVTHLSDTAARRLEVDPASVVGCPLDERLQPQGDNNWLAVMHATVRAAEPRMLRVARVDDDRTFAAMTGRLMPLCDEHDRFNGFTLDLDPQEQTERPASRPALEVARPSPLPASDPGWLLASAHDLREPLRKMHGYAKKLQTSEAPRLSEVGRRDLASLYNAAERMQALVGGMLRLARVDMASSSRTMVDLAQLINETCVDLSMLIAEKGAAIDIGELGYVYGDAAQLRALFQNLIDNSLRYSRESITPDIRIAVTDDGVAEGRLAIDYIDNASGIAAPEDVFSPLLSSEGSAHGNGIGLPLCQRICRRHGGDLQILRTDATGSCFRITLAARRDDPSA